MSKKVNNLLDEKIEFCKFLLHDEKIFKYICNLNMNYSINDFFINGLAYLDDLFSSKVFKKLQIDKQLEILEVLNKYNVRYSDTVYIEALWYPNKIQEFVKNNLPREYSQRHIEDIENY